MSIRPSSLKVSSCAVGASILMLACGAAPTPQSNIGAPAAGSNPPAPGTASSVAEPTTVKSEPTAATGTTPATADAPSIAVAIEPRSGSNLKGSAKLESEGDAVRVVLDIKSGPPGQHGAHIHQNADCSAVDGKSAGDHFNPEMHEHGLPPQSQRHLGDLGNIELDKAGKGHLEILIAGANLTAGDKKSFLDRGIIIHEKIDNGGQPVGNAGSRIGCGEIKR